MDWRKACARLAALLAAGLAVACGLSVDQVSTTGSVRLTVSASGEGRDTAFVITFDSDTTKYTIYADSAVAVALQEGTHVFGLGDVAANCSVVGDNPVSAQVIADQLIDVSFQVTCLLDGHAKVTISTTGVDLDDIYTLDFNGGFRTILVGPNQFVRPSLPLGPYVVQLEDVAPNCTVTSDNPTSLTVVADSDATASFTVVCSAK